MQEEGVTQRRRFASAKHVRVLVIIIFRAVAAMTTQQERSGSRDASGRGSARRCAGLARGTKIRPGGARSSAGETAPRISLVRGRVQRSTGPSPRTQPRFPERRAARGAGGDARRPRWDRSSSSARAAIRAPISSARAVKVSPSMACCSGQSVARVAVREITSAVETLRPRPARAPGGRDGSGVALNSQSRRATNRRSACPRPARQSDAVSRAGAMSRSSRQKVGRRSASQTKPRSAAAENHSICLGRKRGSPRSRPARRRWWRHAIRRRRGRREMAQGAAARADHAARAGSGRPVGPDDVARKPEVEVITTRDQFAGSQQHAVVLIAHSACRRSPGSRSSSKIPPARARSTELERHRTRCQRPVLSSPPEEQCMHLSIDDTRCAERHVQWQRGLQCRAARAHAAHAMLYRLTTSAQITAECNRPAAACTTC